MRVMAPPRATHPVTHRARPAIIIAVWADGRWPIEADGVTRTLEPQARPALLNKPDRRRSKSIFIMDGEKKHTLWTFVVGKNMRMRNHTKAGLGVIAATLE